MALAAAALSGCGSSGNQGHELPSPLNRDFVATSVEGTPAPPISEPAAVHVSFTKPAGRAISWEANCNSFFATVRVGARRLKLSEAGGTLVGCEPALEREDEWLNRFFESDPYWGVEGAALLLRSDGRVMKLREVNDSGSGETPNEEKPSTSL